jgi:SAM-dependent methyltransferase
MAVPSFVPKHGQDIAAADLIVWAAMESFIYERMWLHEERHWWFRARREIVTALVREWAPAGGRILDAGCGTGFIAQALRAEYRVAVMDAAPEAVRLCAKRELPAARAALAQLPYASSTFDLVGCFDVLYHRAAWPLENTLGEIHRVLKSGGVLVAVEPAYQWLFGEADLLDHAQERFTSAGLSEHLRTAGFSVRKAGYFNTYLAPAIVVMRLLRRIWLRVWPWSKPSTEFGATPEPLNRLLEATLGAEKSRVVAGGYPFGVSVICVAQKKGSGR